MWIINEILWRGEKLIIDNHEYWNSPNANASYLPIYQSTLGYDWQVLLL